MDEQRGNGRFQLFRRNSSRVHEPIGRFDTAELARSHASADGKARGLISANYQWGISQDGLWISYCPDWDALRPHGNQCDDYLVIDSEWKPVDPLPPSVFPIDFGRTGK